MREFLVKTFDREEYALRFLHNGEMKFSHIVSFQNIEDCEIRGDKTEGLAIETINTDIGPNVTKFNLGNPNGGKQYVVDWKAIKQHFPEMANNPGKFQFRIEYQVDWLIYCLTYINSTTPDVNKILNKCTSFGEYSTVICDCKDFLFKVNNSIPDCCQGFVKYSNEGMKHPFIKPLDYSWQQEYRIAIPASNIKERFFHIGKLIGFVCKTKSLHMLKQML